MTTTEQPGYIVHRPAWAEETQFVHDTSRVPGILHTWTSSTVADCVEPNGEPGRVEVYIVQRDDLLMSEDGVVQFQPDSPVINAGDSTPLNSTAAARRHAQAILEAWDRVGLTPAVSGPT